MPKRKKDVTVRSVKRLSLRRMMNIYFGMKEVSIISAMADLQTSLIIGLTPLYSSAVRGIHSVGSTGRLHRSDDVRRRLISRYVPAGVAYGRLQACCMVIISSYHGSPAR